VVRIRFVCKRVRCWLWGGLGSEGFRLSWGGRAGSFQFGAFDAKLEARRGEQVGHVAVAVRFRVRVPPECSCSQVSQVNKRQSSRAHERHG
jgi:hypothetical protein